MHIQDDKEYARGLQEKDMGVLEDRRTIFGA
jgi:hypothetical protein